MAALDIRRIRSGLAVALMLALPVVLLRSGGPDAGHGRLAQGARMFGAPMQAGVSYVARVTAGFFERWLMQASLQDKNEEIARENRALAARVRALTALEDENVQLRRALQMRDRQQEDLLSAERIGVDQTALFRVINLRVDRGEEQVGPGMAVLAPDGVVGRIERAYDTYSDVMLVTDARSRVAVEVASSFAPGVLEGRGEDECVLTVSKDYPVAVGDLVRTTGVDDVFPKGHPVGKVLAVEPLVGDQQRLRVLPAVRFDKLQVMWVVLAPAPRADARAPQSARGASGVGPLR